jgi:hypothetical protein
MSAGSRVLMKEGGSTKAQKHCVSNVLPAIKKEHLF